MENVKIEKIPYSGRTLYTFKEKNKKGESLTVEITEVRFDEITKNSLPSLWKRYGYTKKLYDNYLCVECYCYDKKGNCWGRYNPTVKLSEDKKRNVIDFEWLLEISDENKEKILGESFKRFMEAK